MFADPAHAGRLDGAISIRGDAADVRLCLFAQAEAGRVSALRFLAWGCPHLIAAAEAVCAAYEGRPVTELLEFSASGLMQSLPVPVEKTGRILVLEDAARALGKSLRDTSAED